MNLISGTDLAKKIRTQVAQDVVDLGRSPRLNILLVGNDPASLLYVNLKKSRADEVGIRIDIHHLPAETSDKTLHELVASWNADADVDAILIQVPLPDGHDADALLAAMDPKKDADGFHPANIEALLRGEPTVLPPVHEGILRLINETPLKLSGKSAALIINSEIFASPLERLLTTAGMSVEVMPADHLDIALLKEADVIVIAVGRAGFLTPDITKSDAVIIDVGTNRTESGKVVGDVDAKAFDKTDVWLTPVPGGVGPMTIALLLKNVVLLARKKEAAR